MNVLVIDVGGTHVKILATGQKVQREFASGPTLTARADGVAGSSGSPRGWKYDAVSIGYPGPVLRNRPVAEPHNLGRGWMGFDFAAGVRAPGQGRQRRGDAGARRLRGAGRCCSSASAPGSARPSSSTASSSRWSSATCRTGSGPSRTTSASAGSKRLGKKKWRRAVFDVVERLAAALEPDEVVLGGGNVKKLKTLPPGCREGDNANAFMGGFRLWAGARSPLAQTRRRTARRIDGAGMAAGDRPRDRRGRRSRAHYADDPRRASAQALRRRSRARRAPDGGRRGDLPRLLEEPGHRRDAARCSSSSPRSPACARGSTRCSAARRSTSRRTAPSCTSRCARRRAPRSSSTARTSCPRSTRCSTGWPRSRTGCAAARGRATPASASATSSTSASAAPTSGR